ERVTGVQAQQVHAPARQGPVHADLVVDASGRGSHTPGWLDKLGYAGPDESIVRVNLGYATRIYRRDPSVKRRWKALIVQPAPPPGTRGGILFPVEGGRWLATVIGWVGDHPPADIEGYLEFARGLDVPDFYDTIANEVPLSRVEVHHFPANLRRHYERLTR